MTDGIRLSEEDSYGVEHTFEELEWARCRPVPHRVRTPHVGEDVFYRHEKWGEAVHGTVTWVQPSDDVEDPHLWLPQLDDQRRPVLLEGRNLMVPREDPWPTVRVKSVYGEYDTREGRVRGSCGWLPLDWRGRWRPVPEISPASTLRPAFAPHPGLGQGGSGAFVVKGPLVGPLGV